MSKEVGAGGRFDTFLDSDIEIFKKVYFYTPQISLFTSLLGKP